MGGRGGERRGGEVWRVWRSGGSGGWGKDTMRLQTHLLKVSVTGACRGQVSSRLGIARLGCTGAGGTPPVRLGGVWRIEQKFRTKVLK